MIKIDSAKELTEIIKNKKIIIFGTGNIGRRFFLVLKKNNWDRNVESFAVTNNDFFPESTCQGHRVVTADDLIPNNDSIICIAVHDTIKEDIIKELKKRGTYNYIWIYPYILELYLGSPKKANVMIPTKTLIGHCTDYRLAVRYLAVGNYFGVNSCGNDIYIKSQKLSCDEKTAIKRLESFRKMIDEYQRGNFACSRSIPVDSNYSFLDGAHRLSLNAYFSKEEIQCDIFNTDTDIVDWFTPEALMNKECFTTPYFTREELRSIDDTFVRLRGE